MVGSRGGDYGYHESSNSLILRTMSSRHLLEVVSSSLPPHCTPQHEFLNRISSDFHTCVPTFLAFSSTLLGGLSILSWLFAQLPQIFKNYKLQSTAGLSLYFLVEWCLGDATNLLGAILTRQAKWQVVVAGYYVCVDVILVSQYFWYTHYRPWRNENGQRLRKIMKDVTEAGSKFYKESLPRELRLVEQIPKITETSPRSLERCLSATFDSQIFIQAPERKELRVLNAHLPHALLHRLHRLPRPSSSYLCSPSSSLLLRHHK